MLLTAEKTRRLIGGLTIAAFFLGLILGYNNIWNFLFECTRGSKECQKKHVNLFCNLDFKGIKGNCEGCGVITNGGYDCAGHPFNHPAGNEECIRICEA